MGNITWVKYLGAHISYNKACKPINLGAKALDLEFPKLSLDMIFELKLPELWP